MLAKLRTIPDGLTYILLVALAGLDIMYITVYQAAGWGLVLLGLLLMALGIPAAIRWRKATAGPAHRGPRIGPG